MFWPQIKLNKKAEIKNRKERVMFTKKGRKISEPNTQNGNKDIITIYEKTNNPKNRHKRSLALMIREKEKLLQITRLGRRNYKKSEEKTARARDKRKIRKMSRTNRRK